MIDTALPGLGASDLLREVARQQTRVPVVLLTGDGDDGMVGDLLAAGAVDYLPWSLLSAELLGQSIRHALLREEIERRLFTVEDQLRSQAALDPSTGLCTPARLMTVLAEEFERARRHGRALSVIAFEIDHWCDWLQSLGAEGAETFLAELGRTLSTQARQSDCLAQLAEGRFAAVLPETSAQGARLLISRLGQRLPGALPKEIGARAPMMTLSAGMSDITAPPPVSSGEQILLRAADALKWAQGRGAGEAFEWKSGRAPAPAKTD